MARFPGIFLIAFVLPLVLLFVNLIWGTGGILVTIVLFVWIGLAVILMPSEAEG